ncbi:MAG: hypothetical protein Q7R52_04805 [archaeon]|nr:hypothetical protein [archaeon]
MEEKKKASRGLEIVLAMMLGLGTFGSVLGLESNIQPFNNIRIQDSSFRTYLEQGKKQHGECIGAYALALWTYPGVKVGAAIHNYGLTNNSQE